MKLILICAVFVSLAMAKLVKAEETKDFMNDMAKVSEAARKGNGGLDTDTEKAVTEFVTKYGKVRICQYFKAEWEKVGEKLSESNASLKKCCDDDKQGDKEFIQVINSLFGLKLKN